MTSLIVCAIALRAGIAHGAHRRPFEFAGVALGTSLEELKHRYPEVARNPDSDRQFQVYQALALRGMTPKSAIAFNIYRGRVVGGQVMLDMYNQRYWYDKMVERYGNPDSCTYCGDPELDSASWMWGNGARLHIGGGMLTMLTEEGASERHAWQARDDSSTVAVADSGDEQSDVGDKPKPHPTVHKRMAGKKPKPPTVVTQRQPPGWHKYYDRAKTRFSRWLDTWSE